MALEFSVANLQDINLSLDNLFRVNNLDGISLFLDKWGKEIISALKPSLWAIIGPVIAMALTAIAALLIPPIERFLRHKDEKQKSEETKLENINLLLLNLLQCIEDQNDNLYRLREQKKLSVEEFLKENARYVIAKRCDVKLIKSASLKLISDLPDVSFELNRLEDDLYWVKELREQRNNMLTDRVPRQEFYASRIEKEENFEMYILKKLIPIVLALYDYARSRFPKKQVLKLSQKDCLVKVWDYLSDDDLDEVKSFSKLQYEFKDTAIKKWFFETVKKECLQKKKKVKK